MALGLTDHVWTVVEYLRYPVPVSPYQREDWADRRNRTMESALEARNGKRGLPTS